jgi:hypothetical protein
MAITRTIVYDGPDRTDWVETDPSIGYEGFGTDWKSGSPQDNHNRQRDKLEQALEFFETNYQNWSSMTAVQKDAANRNAQRAVAGLIRQILGRADTAGA